LNKLCRNLYPCAQ